MKEKKLDMIGYYFMNFILFFLVLFFIDFLDVFLKKEILPNNFILIYGLFLISLSLLYTSNVNWKDFGRWYLRRKLEKETEYNLLKKNIELTNLYLNIDLLCKKCKNHIDYERFKIEQIKGYSIMFYMFFSFGVIILYAILF